MLRQIRCGPAQDLLIIIDPPENAVAPLAQQPADLPGGVAVINR